MQKKNKIAAAVLMVIIAAVSFAAIAPAAEDPQSGINASTIGQLDTKEKDVMNLAAGAAGASVAIAAVPGDSTTPIAEKFADVSADFLMILCVIFVEKYLVAIFGMLAFRIIIPLACIMALCYLIWEKDIFRRYALKTGVFALILYFLIPASVLVSNIMQDTYQEAIDNGIEAAEMAAEKADEADSEEDKGFLDKIKDTVTGGVTAVVDGVTDYIKEMIEAIAVMIIITCVIPILVLSAFIMAVKLLFQIDIGGNVRMSSFFTAGSRIRRAGIKKRTANRGGKE